MGNTSDKCLSLHPEARARTVWLASLRSVHKLTILLVCSTSFFITFKRALCLCSASSSCTAALGRWCRSNSARVMLRIWFICFRHICCTVAGETCRNGNSSTKRGSSSLSLTRTKTSQIMCNVVRGVDNFNTHLWAGLTMVCMDLWLDFLVFVRYVLLPLLSLAVRKVNQKISFL